MKGAERVAAVDKIEDQRKPEDFIGHRNRKTGWRGDPRTGQRSHHRIWHLHRKYAGRRGLKPPFTQGGLFGRLSTACFLLPNVLPCDMIKRAVPKANTAMAQSANEIGHRFYLPYWKLAKAAHSAAQFEKAKDYYNAGALMARKMKLTAVLSSLITAFLAILYAHTKHNAILTLAITFGTISYHFIMRLLTGRIINLLLHNRVDYRKRWFQVRPFEQKLYKKLRVKKWKGHIATYDPSCFDIRIHSWDEIAQATCQAELVHEVIIVLSFLPVAGAIPFGALPAFVITSVLAAGLDAMFVAIQRYNRPRIIKLIKLPKK